MRRTILWFALAASFLVTPAERAVEGADDDDAGSVRRAIAGYRNWKPTTAQPVLLVGRVFAFCRRLTTEERPSPHEMHYILTYVSPPAREAYDRKTPFPDGTIIVKEKRTLEKLDAESEKTLELGVMIKHGKNWEYSYIEASGRAVAGEKLTHCARCHAAAKNDSVFGHKPADSAPPPSNSTGTLGRPQS